MGVTRHPRRVHPGARRLTASAFLLHAVLAIFVVVVPSNVRAVEVDPLAPVDGASVDDAAAGAAPTDAWGARETWGPGKALSPSIGPLPENVRAIWVVRDALADPEPERIVELARELGANTLFVQISGRGDAWYASDILPRAEGLPEERGDPFARVLGAAAGAGISVHAWINVGLLWSAPDSPESPNHVVNRRPDWIACLPDGAPLNAVPRDSLHAWYVEGLFAELGHADYRAHIASVAREILERYPTVDGIHLDYIRRPVIDTGYDVETVGRFLDQTGRAGWEVMPVALGDAREPRRRPGGAPWYVPTPGHAHPARAYRWPDYGDDVSSPLEREWNGYRREAVTLAVVAVRAQVDAVDALDGRTRVLTAAVIPDPARASMRFAQDWPRWVDDGLLDYVVPMCYAAGREPAAKQIAAVLSVVRPERVIAGTGAYQQPLGACALTLRDMLERNVRGVCIFSWTSLDEKRDVRAVQLVRRAWMPLEGLTAKAGERAAVSPASP